MGLAHRSYFRWLTVAGFVTGAGARSLMAQRILVGRDVRVTAVSAGQLPFEFLAATDPRHAGRVMIAALVMSAARPGGSDVLYASYDDGQTWALVNEDLRGILGSDNDVAYGRGDTVYFSTTTLKYDLQHHFSTGHDDEAQACNNTIYRSMDGGKSWGAPVSLLPCIDRQYLLVDQTTGPYGGRVYVYAGRYYVDRRHGESRTQKPAVLYSADGGLTFSAPVVPSGDGYDDDLLGIGATLSDGALVLPVWGTRRGRQSIEVITSADGGRTLGAPVVVANIRNACGGSGSSSSDAKWGGVQVALAVDTTPGPLHDRLYVAWYDQTWGTCEVWFSHSIDRGTAWTAPTLVSRPVPGAQPLALPENFMPSVVVNKDGVVGVSWYTRRGVRDALGAIPQFAASLDGGVSFLPPVSVASESPQTLSAGGNAFSTNERMAYDIRIWSLSGSGGTLSAVLGLTNWNGPMRFGDTQQMVADRAGVFHPIWIDFRSGNPELWTAPVRVPGRGRRMDVEPPARDPTVVTLDDVTGRVALRFSPHTVFDSVTRDIIVEARLVNTSSAPITGPLCLQMTRLVSSVGPVTVLGAANGKEGVGAAWDLPLAARHVALMPDSMSETVLLRFRARQLTQAAFLEAMRTRFPSVPLVIFDARVFRRQP